MTADTAATILVVDDETLVRQVTSRSLAANGYTVLQAPDGPAALLVAESHPGPIDLLVTDVVMPHMTGVRLAELLLRGRPGTRVLFTSGYLDDEETRRALLADGAPLLRKPFTVADLLEQVRKTLAGSG